MRSRRGGSFPGVTDDRPSAPHAHHLRVQRTARYYTLGGGSGAPRTVWFVLHGYGQLAGEFIRYFSDLATDDYARSSRPRR